MDNVFINDESIDKALRELTVINKWLGGFSNSRRGVKTLLKRIPATKTISVLDAGAGGCDLAAAISMLHPGIHITALDLNKRACEYSKRKHPNISVVHGSYLICLSSSSHSILFMFLCFSITLLKKNSAPCSKQSILLHGTVLSSMTCAGRCSLIMP